MSEAPTGLTESDGLRGVLPAGTRLRDYEITGVLGQGGFGITYRARDTTLDRDVAIKEYLPTALALREANSTVLPRSTALAEEFTWGRDRFLEEARTLAKFDKAPAIVHVFDFLQANGTAYMVMALAEGDTLAQRIARQGALAPPAIDRLLLPLLRGLEEVHKGGFLHRDIKPENILLDRDGHPTLIDFGASRAAMVGRTAAMTAIFTPGYAAPEQLSPVKQGPWTDIYGLSATLYHAIAGHPPASAFERTVDDTYRPLAALASPGFAPGLLHGIDTGMNLRADDRPQSIAQWRAMLGVDGAAGTATIVLPKIRLRGRSHRRLWLGLGAAAAILAVGGVSYWLGMERSARPAHNRPGDGVAQRRAGTPDPARQQERETRMKQQRADREADLKRQVEEEVRQKIDADMAERRRGRAEAGETALNLTLADRQRLQTVLTSLGFDTGGADGEFNERTRAMISAWQKARGNPETGFLTAAQRAALLKEGEARGKN
ncbi:MAG TPA: serine/threonine-protein kinase [Reyranella sp.]|nr:serine/threonine-protein kinase [Reyranella sp.]